MKHSRLFAALLVALPGLSIAATPLAQIRYTPDISVNLAGTLVGPSDVANDNLAGIPNLALSGLPASVAAYYRRPAGFLTDPTWLVFETTAALPGGITATPQDVIGYDGVTFHKIFDGAVMGIPPGVAIDALSSTNGIDFLLSFSTTATVGAVTAAPEDVVQYAGGWSGYFVGSTAGVPAGANLDALHTLSNGHLLVSFDIAGTVGGVAFNAGDVLEYTPAGPVWEMAFSPTTLYAGWGAANLRGLWALEAPPGLPGMLQFSAPTYSVNENGVTATITVLRSGGTTGAVSVQYASANGTAVQPGDYGSAAGTLNWADGDALPKPFTVPIFDDATAEGNETVMLVLSAPGGGASLGAVAAATLTIIDNDLPAGTAMIGLSSPSLAFGNQAVGVASGAQTLVVTSNGNAALNITGINFGGAHAGDFTITSDLCTGASLAPMATCSVGVTFTPSTLGARAATLDIASSDPARPTASAGLGGTGVAAGAGGGGIASIPTLGQWGLALLACLLGFLGAPLSQRLRHVARSIVQERF